MKTRLLGAAVLIALAVLFVPMFFSSKPPAAGGDQSVGLAIPPAPDRDLQTRTMSLDPDNPAGASSAAATADSGDHLATVDIDSRRPHDVGTDAAAKPPVVAGSGASPSQPVIPMRTEGSATTTAAPASRPVAEKPVSKPAPAKPVPAKPAPEEAVAKKEAPKPAAAAASATGRGNYTLNLSAYASASGAANLERQVRALGFPVSSHPITQAGQRRTKVVAGPFETRAAAESARLKITQSIPGAPARLEQHDNGSHAVAAPAAAAAKTGKAGGWAVQLAAVSSQADANAMRDKLRANGFDGFVDSVSSGGKQLWRVRAGPQTQRADAQRVHDQIKAKMGIDGNVVQVP